jgi:RimJ/RimL family protein N-acetyltransferase
MTILVPGPAYRIQTRRLVMRCWNPTDAALEKEAIDAGVDHLLPWIPWAAEVPQELQQKISQMRNARSKFDMGIDFVYGVFDPGETRVIGGTSLHPRVGPGGLEIGYWIRKDALNQGFATEAAGALTRVAFEIEASHRVEIHCDPENLRSAAVPKKLGFTHEATLRQRVPDHQGHWRDSMVWTLLAEDYPTSSAARVEMTVFDAIGRNMLA